MIDIDNFKKINDIFGHSVGDAAIVMVAKKLKELARACDVIARYGGEEFILLLPETSVENAIRLAERIRVCIKSTPVYFQGKANIHISISISIGVSKVINNSDGTIYNAIHRADNYLYQAKNKGRNRIEFE